jgi:hypothetical protein
VCSQTLRIGLSFGTASYLHRLAEDRESSLSLLPTLWLPARPLSPRTRLDRGGFSHCAAQFLLFRVVSARSSSVSFSSLLCQEWIRIIKAMLRLYVAGSLSWAYCHCGQAGRRDAHFVRCNSNRRSYQETFPIFAVC